MNSDVNGDFTYESGLLGSAGNDEEQTMVLPCEVLKQFTVCWQNEIGCPRLLPYRSDLVETMIDQIEGMEENIAACPSKKSFKVTLHNLELRRISFIVKDYLRARLEKIESYTAVYLSEDNFRRDAGQLALLSQSERRFAESFTQASAKLMADCVLGSLPEPLQIYPLVQKTWERERIFIRVLQNDVYSVSVFDPTDSHAEIIVELPKNTVHLLPLICVQDHLENGRVLIL